eukprot:gene14101-20057_t
MLKLNINKLVSKPICGSHGHDYPDFECIDVSASRQTKQEPGATMENVAPSMQPSWYSSNSTYAPAGGNAGAQKPPPVENARLQPTKRLQETRSALGEISVNAIPHARDSAALGKAGYRNESAMLARSGSAMHPRSDSVVNIAPHADKKQRDWIDVDAENKDDPQACSEYAWDICKHMRVSELNRRPNANYLEECQPDVNPKMRAILVDWLVEVGEEYKLCADTLYQAVNYLDRFLSIHAIDRNQLQLVGVASMWIAAKYEEIYPPSIVDFCYITDNTYTKEQVVAMEELVLKKLHYELTVPTAKLFLRRLLQVCSPDEHLHFLSNYLTEISLLDHGMLKFPPSEIAAAAIYLANLILQREPWSGTLGHYSMYETKDIGAAIQALAVLHQVVSNNAQLAAVRN